MNLGSGFMKKTGVLMSKKPLTVWAILLHTLGATSIRSPSPTTRILSVTESEVTFRARGRKPGEPSREISLDHQEFIRRFLMHVLPQGFQKIRYYGFLNNRIKSENLKLILHLRGHQRFRQRYTGISIPELLKAVWNTNICICPACGGHSMRPAGRTYILRVLFSNTDW